MQDLLPRAAVGVETYGDPPDADLFPEERAFVAHAVEVRRREFATVRWCARAGLSRLGLSRVPILPGERGAPTWPEGVVGSMTHCAGYRAAAVAWAADLRCLGVDAEPDEPLPPGVLELVSRPAERAWLRESPISHADRLLFCAKEAVYKAWFPLARRWLGFEEAEVTLHDGTFTARILASGPLSTVVGRWAVHKGVIGAAVVVPA